MWKKNKILVFLIWGIYLPFHSFGQQKASSVFWLFHPVPQGQMREMETDRPDVTESPFTVDAGHLQYETDLVRVTRERSDVKQNNTFLINQANLKIGITRSTAIQIGLQSFGRQQEKDLVSGERTTILKTYYTYDFKAHQWSNFLNAAVQLDVSKEVKLDAGLN